MNRQIVDEIKDRLPIEDIIGSYLTLEKSGKSLKGRCPFHNEKTPSFFVSPERNNYYCFGCGEKGDIFSFIQKMEGMDFFGSLKILADKAGVKLDLNKEDKSNDQRKQIYSINEEVMNIYHQELLKNKEVINYLKNRGVSEETIKNFKIGFAPTDWRFIETKLKSKTDLLLSSGIIIKSPKGYYDRFRSRIIFPIFDSNDRVIAFSGRIFGNDDHDSPKYLNSPETDVFKKGDVLYGYNFAKETIRKTNFAILVEGQMDLILSQQAGFKNTVASSGTALTLNHLRNLRRICQNIVFAFDSDKAGLNALYKALSASYKIGFRVKIVSIENGKDPADIAGKDSQQWKKIIRESKEPIPYLYDQIKKVSKSKEEIIQKCRNIIIPIIASDTSSINRANMASQLADIILLPKESVIKEVEEFVLNPKNKDGDYFFDTPDTAKRVKENLTKNLLKIIFGTINWSDVVRNNQEIKSRLLEIKDNFDIVDLDEPEMIEAVFESENKFLNENEQKVVSSIKEMLDRLEKELLKAEQLNINNLIKEAEMRGDIDSVKKLLEKHKVLSSKMHNKKAIK